MQSAASYAARKVTFGNGIALAIRGTGALVAAAD